MIQKKQLMMSLILFLYWYPKIPKVLTLITAVGTQSPAYQTCPGLYYWWINS
ncbi:hypothetical protein AB205_0042740 [Aquarana catesbeiana]|uniref:Uncharacterized protein n=1 Tax=Aquarana catesbeiana TaxID=8400 RepID=A0A2G9RR38_AQUCT|nr:hypothetical protein AB205_0042740 [Aquarana catesbeiana]